MAPAIPYGEGWGRHDRILATSRAGGLLDRLGRASRAISSAVIALAYSRVTATSRRLTFPVSVALVAAVSALHPAVQVLSRAFLAEYPAVCLDTGSAIHTLLRKGPGFIPTPSCADAVFELAGFTCAAAVHPKATLSPDEKAVFFNKVIRLARTMLLPQNLSHELRSCLQEAKKTLGFVFVETDKTGQLVKVPEALIKFAIEATIRSKRGVGGFDLFDDPVCFALQLQAVKASINDTVDVFRRHALQWRSRWVDRDPFLALQPPLATALADGVEACAGYLPAFGSVKPLIKGHKMKIPLSQWLEQWTLQSSEILPLRLVHKATVGPSQPIASLICQVLEALAAVCTCALGQAANDIVRFCAEHAFSFCPAIATMDVTDAFWKMQERTILRRTKAVADDNPAILEFFVVSWETIELALHVILQDNFFVAPAFSSAAIYGRFTGCTMGNWCPNRFVKYTISAPSRRPWLGCPR